MTTSPFVKKKKFLKEKADKSVNFFNQISLLIWSVILLPRCLSGSLVRAATRTIIAGLFLFPPFQCEVPFFLNAELSLPCVLGQSTQLRWGEAMVPPGSARYAIGSGVSSVEMMDVGVVGLWTTVM
jgi:hypothetical protein